MLERILAIERWLFASDPSQSPGRLAPRWIFLRAFGLICFSAFYALLFQAPGLIGPNGLLPAGPYLNAVKLQVDSPHWYAPTVLWWIGTSDHALVGLAWVGIIASLLLVLNVWPRLMAAICLLVYMSFIGALQAFASYQSDGMLLGAAFLCIFFAPRGLWPSWGERSSPSRASLFLLQWLWFCIYFESGLVKILGGDPEWRNFTAMEDYYQNGPLPTWVAWYAGHLPHWFHAGSTGLTLVLELGLVWMMFLPRPFRLILFFIVTPWQIGIILTSNYAFLNYEVLALGILLLDDKYLWFCLPKRLRPLGAPGATAIAPVSVSTTASAPATSVAWGGLSRSPMPPPAPAASASTPPQRRKPPDSRWANLRRVREAVGFWLAAICLTLVFYTTAAEMVWIVFPDAPLPEAPATLLAPFRIAERYGLFAVMTRGRYEIEFQGSNDGANWTPYPFCYKPQDPAKSPRIFAPYQPRFDWNLWFASLGSSDSNRFVLNTELQLLRGSPEVLSLFCGDPFPTGPPKEVRAMLWQYWFSDRDQKRQGLWWRRMLLGTYAPVLERDTDNRIKIVGMPQGLAVQPRQ